ncbi:MAG: hypothetical protein GC154_03920 [bacterium]|nr:hypothetical protein [bacterium]
MTHTFKETVTIKSGGLIEIRRPDLPEGAIADVELTVHLSDSSEKFPRFSDFFGQIKNCFVSGDEMELFFRAERDSWERRF